MGTDEEGEREREGEKERKRERERERERWEQMRRDINSSSFHYIYYNLIIILYLTHYTSLVLSTKLFSYNDSHYLCSNYHTIFFLPEKWMMGFSRQWPRKLLSKIL